MLPQQTPPSTSGAGMRTTPTVNKAGKTNEVSDSISNGTAIVKGLQQI